MTLNDYIIDENLPLIDTLKKIDKNASGNIFICSDGGILMAAVSDGDIRRSLVKGVDMQTPIKEIANYNPLYIFQRDIRKAYEIMQEKTITALPIVDENKCIIDIKLLLKEQILEEQRLDVPVVIMAGGKGTRLKPYTDILPKPLIPIGDKTITEHIIDRFQKYGCKHFEMIINYKKNFIKSYFSDNDTKIDIQFTEEEKFLGTGGGIALIGDKVLDTFFLTNCDILIDTDYARLLKIHRKMGNIITIVCARKKVVVPYGTVEIDPDGYARTFKEKPCFEFNTSTGLYVIEPRFLDKIPQDTFINITDIIEKCMNEGEKVGTYLIEDEDWMDMGQLEELEKMKEKMGL
ncbi:MAG: sugar phosphate nucleotidyltransferase [Lachnospiraceae bacterium]|nr:sugar phosphate nucleotidyltransferase [Lachnospiraceae bacterium]